MSLLSIAIIGIIIITVATSFGWYRTLQSLSEAEAHVDAAAAQAHRYYQCWADAEEFIADTQSFSEFWYRQSAELEDALVAAYDEVAAAEGEVEQLKSLIDRMSSSLCDMDDLVEIDAIRRRLAQDRHPAGRFAYDEPPF